MLGIPFFARMANGSKSSWHASNAISWQWDMNIQLAILDLVLPCFVGRIQYELAASLAATAVAELPCAVKLRIWSHDVKNPCVTLNAGRCRLTISHSVLSSEMGAHFSPCGRFLAACVACALPQMEAVPGLLTEMTQDVIGAAMSPTRHPISARQVAYELRIYSLEESTFSRCLYQGRSGLRIVQLLSIRRHCSLLKSIVINGETSAPIYTVLEFELLTGKGSNWEI